MSDTLDTASRFPDPDRAYRMIVEAHRGIAPDEVAAFRARLILILANHIGDETVLADALALAAHPEGPK